MIHQSKYNDAFTMTKKLSLPPYAPLAEALKALALPFSLSQLHGLICAYICTGNHERASSFIQTIITNKKYPVSQKTKTQLFKLITYTEHQIDALEFGFQLLLPDETISINERAQAFKTWCEGFVQGLHTCRVQANSFDEGEEAHEILTHLQAFTQLNQENISLSDADEQALMEIYEYTRLAVLSIKTTFASLHPLHKKKKVKH